LLPILLIVFLQNGIEIAAARKYTDSRIPPSDFPKRSASLKKKTKSKAGIEFANVLKKHNTKNNFILDDSKEKKFKFILLTLVEKAVSIDTVFISSSQVTETMELRNIIRESTEKDSNAINTEETINPISTNTSLPEINLFLVSAWLDQANAQL
tara:strand:- start:19 stop:480 length:462 start_codon:yes stop_codon:yes gene_type:complete